MIWILVFIFLVFPGLGLAENISIFDVHSHYKTEDAVEFSPDDVIRIMDENNISQMVIVGQPPERALDLYQQAPDRIIPLLGLYQSQLDKTSWMHDPLLPGIIENQLKNGEYKGIGEIHIFAQDKDNANFRKILGLADKNKLPVLLHGDRSIIQQAFKWFPSLIIIWAHLGEDPNVKMLEQMLTKYPKLYFDTSVRDVLIIKDRKLLPEWKNLFMKYPDRFMVAIDTYYTPRWQRLDKVTGFIRKWLAGLPKEVTRKMAYENAEKLFLSN